MKILMFMLTIANYTFGMDTLSCDTASEKPKIIRASRAPEYGQYVKVRPYFVTGGKNDPYTEEILYFIILKELNLKNSSIGTSADYLRFHNYFKAQLTIIEKQREADKSFVPIGLDETYPIIRKFITKNWLSISEKEFSNIIDKNESTIKEVKNVFSIKSNTTYYEVHPTDASVVIDQSSSLPLVTLRTDHSSLRITVAASKLTLYKNKTDEKADQLKLINNNLSLLKYIEKVLPTKGSPLKGHLKKYINQELE